jgi:hypothetical protein
LIEDDESGPHRVRAAVEFSYDHRSRLLSGTDELPSGSGGFDISALTLEAEYRLPAGLAARLRLPFYWKTFSDTGQADLSLDGVGDLELSGGWDYLRSAQWTVSVGAGVALPTGSTSAQPIAGSAVPTPLQLGTGTVDPIVSGLGVYRPIRPVSLHLAMNGRIVRYANRYGYEAASVYTGALGGAFRAREGLLTAALDGALAHTTHTSVAHMDVPNTGRDVLYLSPSVRIRVTTGILIEAAVRLPVFQDVNGTQFGETIETSVGLSYTSPPLVRGR